MGTAVEGTCEAGPHGVRDGGALAMDGTFPHKLLVASWHEEGYCGVHEGCGHFGGGNTQ